MNNIMSALNIQDNEQDIFFQNYLPSNCNNYINLLFIGSIILLIFSTTVLIYDVIYSIYVMYKSFLIIRHIDINKIQEICNLVTTSEQLVEEQAEEHVEEESDDSSTELSESSEINNLLKMIEKLDDNQIEKVVEKCCTRLLIPNWYTKDDYEIVADTVIKNNEWKSLLRCEYIDDLTKKTNSMIKKWSNIVDLTNNSDSDYEQSDSDSDSD